MLSLAEAKKADREINKRWRQIQAKIRQISQKYPKYRDRLNKFLEKSHTYNKSKKEMEQEVKYNIVTFPEEVREWLYELQRLLNSDKFNDCHLLIHQTLLILTRYWPLNKNKAPNDKSFCFLLSCPLSGEEFEFSPRHISSDIITLSNGCQYTKTSLRKLVAQDRRLPRILLGSPYPITALDIKRLNQKIFISPSRWNIVRTSLLSFLFGGALAGMICASVPATLHVAQGLLLLAGLAAGMAVAMAPVACLVAVAILIGVIGAIIACGVYWPQYKASLELAPVETLPIKSSPALIEASKKGLVEKIRPPKSRGVKFSSTSKTISTLATVPEEESSSEPEMKPKEKKISEKAPLPSSEREIPTVKMPMTDSERAYLAPGSFQQ